MKTQRAHYLLTLIAAFAAFPLVANGSELISPLHYGDELDRCVAKVRSYLAQPEGTRITHKITAIAAHGAWYEFELVSEPEREAGPTAASLHSTCRANRFSQATVLVADEAAIQPVVARRQ